MIKKQTIICLLLFICISTIKAQNVKDLNFYQDGNSIKVEYTLNLPEGKIANVELFVSTDGGKTLKGPLKHVTGDVGELTEGGQKTIQWKVFDEFEKLEGDISFQVKVSMRNIPIKKEKFIAYNISGSFSASATVHYISSKLGTEAAGSAYAADLGLMYQPGNFSLGLTATNLGSKIDYGYGPYTLPAQIKLGAGYHFSLQEKHLLTAAVQAGYLIVNSGITAGIGLEYSYNNLISLRVGGHYGNPEKGIPSHLSAGLGFNFKGLTLNAAYLLAQKDSPLANSLSVGLGWAF